MSTIKGMPLSERPRERLLQQGCEALSTAELIAILWGTGMKGKSVITLAQELLATFGNLTELSEKTIQDLCQIKGLGRAKALQLTAALALATRLAQEKQPSKLYIKTPQQAFLFLKDRIGHEKKEVFGVMLLDIKGVLIRWEKVSVGTLNQTLVHPREVFYPAVKHLAASILLAHNHPSGDPSPSQQDITVTQELLAVSQWMKIPIYDHVIITSHHCYSFRESRKELFLS